MRKITYAQRKQSFVYGIRIYLISLFYCTLCLRILLARQHGMSITRALASVFSWPNVLELFVPVLAGLLVGVSIFFLLTRNKREREMPEYLQPVDERLLMVQGKASSTTFAIFAGLLFFAGAGYEVLCKGEWPIRSGIEIVLLSLLHFGALQYWNNKF